MEGGLTLLYAETNYSIHRIASDIAKNYIVKNHYTHGCINAPSVSYGLYEKCESYIPEGELFNVDNRLIGVIVFACPCSENVRKSVFGEEYKDSVLELHRLHILDVTPPNTESWFISRCLKLLAKDRPDIHGIISFSDSTIGHSGIIYQATNAIRCGSTGTATFYLDKNGRLRHPRQNGVNISPEYAQKKGWTPIKRGSKNRYLYIIGRDNREIKQWQKKCKLIKL